MTFGEKSFCDFSLNILGLNKLINLPITPLIAILLIVETKRKYTD